MGASVVRNIDIVFDGPPGPEAGRFVEVESPPGTSISYGEWVHREDGHWVLRFPAAPDDLLLAAKEAAIVIADAARQVGADPTKGTVLPRLMAAIARASIARGVR